MILRTSSRPFLNAHALLDELWRACPNQRSYIHGQHHWQCVAAAGLALARETPGCDAGVVLLFSLFHDCRRRTDDHDPDHGRRAAEAVDEYHGSLFRIRAGALLTLKEACRQHADGGISRDPTVGACWDADRLNLWRGGVRPDPDLLSTAFARRAETIEYARDLWRRRLHWTQIFRGYARFNRLMDDADTRAGCGPSGV